MAAVLRKVALVGGSGHLGPYLLKALQENPAFDVTVVSRQSSKATFPPNTNIIKVSDVYTKNEMLDAFKGQDAVILSLNYAAEFQHHNMLVDASVEAGVKRLIPSIWGGRLDLPGALDVFPLAASKHGLLEYVKFKASSAPDWSYTAVVCGLFHELCIQTNFYGLDPQSYSAKIWDDGNTKFSATTQGSIGHAVTKILSKPTEIRNRTVFISSFETSLNELLAAYKTATDVQDWEIEHGEVEKGIKEAQEFSVDSQNLVDKMRAIARLGLLVNLRKDLGGDFVAAGLSDNELLEVPREDVTTTVKDILKG